MGVTNVFPVQTGGSGSSSDHNSLTNIQGGSSNQYYHLTSAQYSSVIGFLADGAGTPVAVSKTIDFRNEQNYSELSVSDATITAKTIFSITHSNEDLFLQNVQFTINGIPGVGYTIKCYAPQCATGQYAINVIKQETL